MYKPTVVFVSPLRDTCDRFWDLANDIKFIPIRKYSIQQLFAHLNDPVESTDLIIFDLEELYKDSNTDVLDIIKTINTLTVFSNGKPPVLSVLVGETSDPDMIRNAMKTNIKGFIPKAAYATVAEDSLAIRTLLAGNTYVSDRITDMINTDAQKDRKLAIIISSKDSGIVSTSTNKKSTGDIDNISVRAMPNVRNMIDMLNSREFAVDFMMIDIEDFYEVEGANAHNLLESLHTMIRSSDKSKKCKIIGIVSNGISVASLKEALLMPIDYFSRRSTGAMSNEDLNDIISNCLNSGLRVPKIINDMMKIKKLTPSANQIMLTSRQAQILKIICDRGASNKSIARQLDLSESAIKQHIGCILKKYGLTNRTQLALFVKIENVVIGR